MDSTIRQASRSAYVVVGPEGATNFAIIKGTNGRAVLIDADIRRIDEVEEALELTGCSGVECLINTHEHFDHTSANFYFRRRGVPIVASAGSISAMRDEGEADFARMLKPVPELYERFPGLGLTLPDAAFSEKTAVAIPGATLHLQYRAVDGHSHSKGDTTIYFEQDEVFIAGDLLYTEVHPVTFFGNIETALRNPLPASGAGPRSDGGGRSGRPQLLQKDARLSRGLLRPPPGHQSRTEGPSGSRRTHARRSLRFAGKDAHGGAKHPSVSHRKAVLTCDLS